MRDKTIWITGASSGIGAALARTLAARGASLVLSGRRPDALEAVAAECDTPVRIIPFEATDLEILPDVVAEATAGGGIDLLVNNAGVSQRSIAVETDFATYRQIMEVDFFAPLRLTQLVLPHMVARGSGHLAVVSSIAGKLGAPLRTGYCAAKHAVIGYFDALRSEIEGPFGIGVSVIVPGAVRTQVAVNALGGDGQPVGAADPFTDGGMTAEDAALIIADGLAARRREIVVVGSRELDLLSARAADPEAVFAEMGAIGSRAALRRDGAPGRSGGSVST